MSSKESPIEWRDRVLNSKSKSFCGAKWYNATIWLGNGATTSCHHPPAHKIDPDEVKLDPSALHNTTYKKLVRKEMQDGIQTRECEYCWKMENLDKTLISDRSYKSELYSEADLQAAFDSDWRTNFNLKTLEIAFDNNCNFACSYCNAGFSTTWAHDVNKNGVYENLCSDGWAAFSTNGKWASPYGPKNEGNPFIDAFWKWWESDLQYTLSQLRVTGGEATVSNDFWKLVSWYETHPDCKVRLGVNTNLGIKKSAMDRLIQLSNTTGMLDIYTSNEAMSTHAEYIRDGLIWTEWRDNFTQLVSKSKIGYMHVMCTINALCLASLDKFVEFIIDIRDNHNPNKIEITTSMNILRFPSFQSITTLPKYIRDERAAYYKNWLAGIKHKLMNHEIDSIERTIQYIEHVEEGHSVRSLSDLETRQNDFYNFYTQYDKRRNKDINESFKDWPELIEWFSTKKNNSNVNYVKDIIQADATEWGADIRKEVFEDARNKKLIND